VPYRSWCNSFATKSSANNLSNCLELFSCHPLFRHVIIFVLLLFQAYRTLECNNLEFEKVLRRATTQQPYQRMTFGFGPQKLLRWGPEMAPDPSSHETTFIDMCASVLDRLFAHIDGRR
jgi:hypothetical protein